MPVLERGKCGAIENFFILKMELFHSFAGSIKALGGLIQYSADTHGTPLVNAIATEDNIVAEMDPTLAWIARTLPITVAPDRKSLTIPDLQYTYALPDFAAALTEYISKASQGAPTTSWTCQGGSVRTWNKFRIQLLSNFQSRIVMPSQVVQSYPPSEAFPFGNRERSSHTTSTSHKCIAFSKLPAKKGHTLPRYLEAAPLLYVQYFKITAMPADEPSIGMYRVKRIIHQDGMGRIFQPGSVIPLTASYLCRRADPCVWFEDGSHDNCCELIRGL
ncbi:hypothetical protein DFJ58DRAFT_845539 [Suillus subalutaceus]|uniref:uncharacterized protein n=1 Tax=Suillus subalutaceus TaxID=48586 RepID=UPI001B8665C2|nr:uncharacterized protein DFJ58DRAFT_845539 [Suillus subalutaceus]KAG1839885.1 hypothetical protein DFJ58DRAFT_845539 [Suillus subalutaceus]